MKKWMLLALLSFPGMAVASDPQPATEASIRELLLATEADKLLDQVYAQMMSLYDRAPGAEGGAPTADEVQARHRHARLSAFLRSEMGWDAMAPALIEVYRKVYTEQEVRDMLAFYRTPTGRSLIRKQPLVMQHSMEAMQVRMKTLEPAIRKLIEETSPAPRGGQRIERH